MEKRFFEVSALIVLILFFMVCSVFAFPNFINYQGQLTDSSGNPLNGDYALTFMIYDTETEGEALWTEQHTITAANGLYNTELGTVNPFPEDLFETEVLYLEVIIHNEDTGSDETLSPRIPFTSTGFSMKAKDSETVAWSNISGKPEDFVDNIDDVNDTDADPTNEIQILGVSGNNITLSKGGGNITVPYAASADTANDADKLDGKDSSKFGDGHSLDAVDGDPIDAVYVDSNGYVGIGTSTPNAALQVIDAISRQGTTLNGTTNTHVNLGINSTTEDGYSTVSGGHTNTASGYGSTVSGGWGNTASGPNSTVSGGNNNNASGDWFPTVSGGYSNNANGHNSTVSGGTRNTASGGSSTVSGGYINAASGAFSTVSGGG